MTKTLADIFGMDTLPDAGNEATDLKRCKVYAYDGPEELGKKPWEYSNVPHNSAIRNFIVEEKRFHYYVVYVQYLIGETGESMFLEFNQYDLKNIIQLSLSKPFNLIEQFFNPDAHPVEKAVAA